MLAAVANAALAHALADTRCSRLVQSVYATCLFCNTALGRNESLESFPVGRRLAFDPARGHLWVVCGRCERWNLSPFETRWEAIEQAERHFRGASLRVSTDNIGLAQLREGLELVRIGAPLRAEFSAWRYGDQFGRRRRKHVAAAATGFSAVLLPALANLAGVMGVGLIGGGIGAIVLAGVGLSGTSYMVADAVRQRRERRATSVFIADSEGRLLRLTLPNARAVAFQPASDDPSGWCLDVPNRIERAVGLGGEPRAEVVTVTTHTRLAGPAALRALTKLLPHLNREGGSTRSVRDAVAVIESVPTLGSLLRAAATSTIQEAGTSAAFQAAGRPFEENRVGTVGRLPTPIRLALEIALHEEDERRAMEGELLQLENRWREAEVIASIADSLLLPPQVTEQLEELRSRLDTR